MTVINDNPQSRYVQFFIAKCSPVVKEVFRVIVTLKDEHDRYLGIQCHECGTPFTL